MGHAAVTVLVNVSAEHLHEQFTKHLSLYRPHPETARKFSVEILAGTHCSAIWCNQVRFPQELLRPLGPQFAAVWMECRYQDGDSWDLTCYTGFEQELFHSVNPWAYEPDAEYHAEGIKFRIDRLCKLMPQFADAIRPYLLLWRYPPDPSKPKNLVDRKGKARPTDNFEYGDADQWYDFLNCFGLDVGKPQRQVAIRI